MTKLVPDVDVFNQEYRDRIRNAVWQAIVGGSHDPVTNLSPLRNYEIYDALLQIQAMLLASSKDASSPSKMRKIGNLFAERLRRLVAEYNRAYNREGPPFEVIHTDEMQ